MVTMATSISHTDSERENFFRITILIVDYGVKVLQNVLQKELTRRYPHLFDPSTGLLCGVLSDATVRATLFGLSSRVFYHDQRKQLYPAGKPSTSVTVGDLDITLTVLLLRNITTLNPRSKAWDNPSDADTSRESAIGRVKRYRNMINNVNKPAISDQNFRVHFSGLKTNLLSLSSVYTSEDYDNILTRPFDFTLTGQEDIQITEAIYQAACAEGMQKVYKANVIVVGHQGTGKTHLCRNLLGEQFTEDDLVTNGIEVSGCILEKHETGPDWHRKEESLNENYCNERLARGIKEYESVQESKSKFQRFKDLLLRKTINTYMQATSITIDKETIDEVLEKSEGQPDVPDLLTLWDFGGQYVFYTTHQTFLTWRAVYLLVFDLTKELNDPVHVERVGRTGRRPVDSVPDTVGDFLKFWQNSIHIHTEIVRRKDPGFVNICPRILLVGTHKDQLGKTEEERMKAAKEKFRKIQEFLDGRPAHDMHVQSYFYAVNNCDQQDAGIKELKEAIWETIHAQPYWGEEQPLKYVLLEKKLKEISRSRKCLSLEEVIQEGKRYGFDVAEKVLFFLKFYCEGGELVFFNEDGIRDIIILDPQWLIKAFASLITVKKYHKVSNLDDRGYWKMLDDGGELDERLIDSVWETDNELKANKAILLRICQRFDLLVELKEEDADGQWKKYLVPCLLKKQPNPEGYLQIPEYPPKGYLKMQKIPPLYLMFDGGFCPPGLFHRLVVCCYRKWSSHDKKPYCNYACFKVDRSTHTILELCNEGDGTFKLMVGSLKKGVNVLERDSAFQVLSYIRQELDRLIDAYFPYLKYSIGFRFPHGLEKLTEDLKTEMLENEDVCPPGCGEDICTAPYMKWLRNDENTVCPSARIAVYPRDDWVCDFAKNIGKEWEEVAAYLGVERPQVDRLKLDNPGNTLGQIRNMLFQWREGMETSSNEERRDKLKEALERAGRKDLADSIASDQNTNKRKQRKRKLINPFTSLKNYSKQKRSRRDK